MKQAQTFKVNRFSSHSKLINSIGNFVEGKKIISMVTDESLLSSTVTVVVESNSPYKHPGLRKQAGYGKSKYRGVSWNNQIKRWRVRFYHKGKSYCKGSYLHAIDAAKAYDELVVSIVGPGDYLNFSEEWGY